MDTKAANSARVKALLEFVHMVLSNSKLQDSAHDLDHTLRVWKIGMQIGEVEKANLEILEPALILHDIVRPASFLDDAKDEKTTPKAASKINFKKSEQSSIRKTEGHASESAMLARKILPDFYYKEDEIERNIHAIESHSNNGKNTPKTLEAKIVYDADCYDTLGFSGCARCALFCARQKMTTSQMGEWYLLKIKNLLKAAPFFTPYAIRLANDRLTISLEFCKELVGRERFEELMKR